ncbi:MAG: histidine phosphatase family protein [Sphingomonadales bacterium]|jgi:probable phosphoglycerate mutase
MTNCLYIVRHGETVFNRAARMQGRQDHTPLTKSGVEQAISVGEKLLEHLGPKPNLDLWASPAGRTRQTMALICDVLDLNYFDVKLDSRLLEIDVGDWSDRPYAEIHEEIGPFVDMEHRLFTKRPPGGEWYDDVAKRMQSWLGDFDKSRPSLVVTHGMAGRVLRGEILNSGEIAPDAPQGSIFHIAKNREQILTPRVVGAMTPA